MSNCKLTSEKVAAIRRRLVEGEGVCFLAREYGISVGTLCRIKTRKAWAHV